MRTALQRTPDGAAELRGATATDISGVTRLAGSNPRAAWLRHLPATAAKARRCKQRSPTRQAAPGIEPGTTWQARRGQLRMRCKPPVSPCTAPGQRLEDGARQGQALRARVNARP